MVTFAPNSLFIRDSLENELWEEVQTVRAELEKQGLDPLRVPQLKAAMARLLLRGQNDQIEQRCKEVHRRLVEIRKIYHLEELSISSLSPNLP